MKHNLRAPLMFDIISSHVSFKDATVLDLGCGYGDMCSYALVAGARKVVGVDQNPEMIKTTTERCSSESFHGLVGTVESRSMFDLASQVIGWKTFNIGYFFSVFPYLNTPIQTLTMMRTMCDVCFVEAQYVGDGPGTILDTGAMEYLLSGDGEDSPSVGFWEAKMIGFTVVKGRDTKREIWLCSN